MKDLCHDVFGIAKEKKDAREVQSNRGMYLSVVDHEAFLKGELFWPHGTFFFFPICADLLDALPSKRKAEEGGYLSDDGPEVLMSWFFL